jgi:hypothetical protein
MPPAMITQNAPQNLHTLGAGKHTILDNISPSPSPQMNLNILRR